MSKFRHFLDRILNRKTEEAEAPKSFWEEVREELRKRLVGYSATFIFWAIGLVIFFMGGYIIYDRIQEAKDRKRNYHEVCIDGYVLDTYEGEGLEAASVHVEGDPEWTTVSNTSGYFRICITLPKSQRSVNLTIEKTGYMRQKYDQVAVPDNENARRNVQHFNLTSVKKARSEPLLN